eukprot:238742-Amphidinium_carterae.1
MRGWMHKQIEQKETERCIQDKGYMTLAHVGECLKLSPAHYDKVEDFYCDMLRELNEFWDRNHIPKEQRCLNPEASAQRQKYYYVHEGVTQHITQIENSTVMAKRME